MDGPISITPHELYARLGTASAPIVIDVRRPATFSAADQMIIGAFHQPPDEVNRWRGDLPPKRSIVAYCALGHEVGQGGVAALRLGGIDAVSLPGGMGAGR